jgi:glycosyltransferase involved in cell wall biosynthesis
VEYAPDVVIFQWWQPFFAPAYRGVISTLKRQADIPVLFLCHNVLPHESLPIPGSVMCERLLTRRVLKKVDGFLVHSNKMVDDLREFNRTAPVRTIYHPLYDFYLEWDRIAPKPSRGETLHLLFFGKIRRYKGLSTFLEALALVKEQLPVHAVIAGEFYVSPEPYRRLADRLGLSDVLKWIGHYIPNEQVPGLFRSADLVVLPYKQATQSGVVPVAYQFEVPVVATDVGGLSEVVLEGETGYLVPVADSIALARKIIEYQKEGKKSLFQQNIRAFRDRLSWEQVVDAIIGLLRDLRHKNAT